MGLEEEVHALRVAMERSVRGEETLKDEISKLSTIAETLKGHQQFLQGLVQSAFKHQQQQDEQITSAFIKWLGWVLAGAVAIVFGAKVTGVF